jgi:hypothetical protein
MKECIARLPGSELTANTLVHYGELVKSRLRY